MMEEEIVGGKIERRGGEKEKMPFDLQNLVWHIGNVLYSAQHTQNQTPRRDCDGGKSSSNGVDLVSEK